MAFVAELFVGSRRNQMRDIPWFQETYVWAGFFNLLLPCVYNIKKINYMK